MPANPKHGEVWLADMGLAGKLRPVVVVLADGLAVERTLIVHVPITTQNRGSVLEVGLGHLSFLLPESVANAQAIGALPAARFERRLGVLPPEDLDRVKEAIRTACGL
jgi:mRNA interferase MazF